MTKYERLLDWMERKPISQLDCREVGVTAVSQHCNRLRRNVGGKLDKYLKGREVASREVKNDKSRWVEYYIVTK